MATPDQIAEKWSRRLQQSTEDIRAGVNAVTVNPGEQAIAKKDKMVNNFNAAVADGKWERGLRRMSLEDWKRSMIDKGLTRIGTGAQAAQPKMAAFMRELMPYIESLQGQVNDMPDMTLEDSINKMIAWTRGMSEFTRS